MDWRDSEVSDDETVHDLQATSRKRSSRGWCTPYSLLGASLIHRLIQLVISAAKPKVNVRDPCTFLGPSYKRGPPKGYIHAIEQRWHQVESLLGAILQCPDARVQEFVNDLKQDELAREIIDRVDMGPYGPAGRRSQPPGATKEDFFASILRSNGSNDHGLSVAPTKEWQDNLSRRLAGSSSGSLSPASYGGFRASSSATSLSSTPATQRRRLNDSVEPAYSPDWNGMYTFNQEAKSFHISRPSTVQALLLLGYREFGIGSMEQGWIFIVFAKAFDLGLNCDSSKWKVHGHDLFSQEETQTRRQVWWACILADRYGSIYMGRPTMIKDSDSDTPLPHVDSVFDAALWQPLPSHGIPYTPTPGRIMSSFVALSRLSLIAGTIINKVYPVQGTTRAAKQSIMAECEAQLDQWYLSLPDYLRCDPSSRRGPYLPQIIFLHVRYWGCVLLLYRAFIPNWKSNEEVARNSPIGSKALDLAQSAASHISSLVMMYRENLTLKRASPFLTAYLLSASIMHILTLSLRSSHVEATLGLQQCMSALKDMEVVWPSASRAWELLNGVKMSDGMRATQLLQVQGQSSDRHKRVAEDAFGQEKDYSQREVYDERGNIHSNQGGFENQNGVHDLSTRIMAHMLGLDIPGIEPSTSYYPGYQWWPRTTGQGGSSTQAVSQPISPPIPGPSQLGGLSVGPQGPVGTGVSGLNGNSLENWAYPSVSSRRIPESYSYDFSQFGP
ncbi:Nitrogen assimilation transcription factor nirA [Leucoagaricus sp. SymC.cos]|nr:Nitrogen assimilation transcription factor nirA [Leucoagaricus sp. SymC.cos]